jgi:lipoprotein-releasing system permease protein
MRAWIERQRTILDFTLSSLGRRNSKNAALLLLYALVVFGLASILFFTQALRHEAEVLLRDVPDVVVQKLVAGRHDLFPERDVEVLRSIKGVTKVRGRLWGYQFDAGSGANFTLLVPEDWWGRETEVAAGQGVARLRRLDPGSLLPFVAPDGFVVELRVRELIPTESELVSSDLVLLSERAFRRISGVAPGLFTDVALSVRNAKEIPTVAAKVRHLLPASRPITRSEIQRTYESIFEWRSGLVVVMLFASLLAFAIVAWDKASGLSAEERREIGILKAIGWETSDVLLVRAWEGAVISLGAFALGVLAAYAHVFLTPAPLLEPMLKGWSTLYPRFRLVPFLSPSLLFTLFFFTVVPYTVATVVPSWRAATTDPDEVMRS